MATGLPAAADLKSRAALPHCVVPTQVEGMHDPLEARVVLHGWFTQPSPFFAGGWVGGWVGVTDGRSSRVPQHAALLSLSRERCISRSSSCRAAPPASRLPAPPIPPFTPPAPPPPTTTRPLNPAGSLSEEAATPALNACLQGLYAALGGLPPVVGVVTLRLAVEPSGHVADIAWLANTLVARPQGVAAGEAPDEPCQATLATIAEHLLVARFPSNADGGETVVTLPFVFE